MTYLQKFLGMGAAIAIAALSPSMTYAKHSGTDERKVEKPRIAAKHTGTDERKAEKPRFA